MNCMGDWEPNTSTICVAFVALCHIVTIFTTDTNRPAGP